MIKIGSLKKSYSGRTVVDIPSLTLRGGDIVALVGNNGAGKTTLMRLMLDLTRADGGSVFSDGIDVAHDERWKDFTGAWLGDGFLPDFLTTEEFLDFVARLSRIGAAELERRLASLAGLLEDVDCHRLLRHLSSGARVKAGIAGALLSEPRVLLFDEPFNFLDPSSQLRLIALLQNYAAAHPEALILFSSHNLTHVGRLSSRILLMEGGRIERDIRPVTPGTLSDLEAYFTACDR